jgi:hypothetical protein
MTPISAHSAKGLETLRQMGCDTNGWRTPEIRWEKRMLPIPTKVRCPKCAGSGQVPDMERRAAAQAPGGNWRDQHAMTCCPKCPARRNWPNHGIGEVTELVEREVEVGIIVWPEGTRFDSRFGHGCELCSKTIKEAMPVLGFDAAGQPHGMWVGLDCGRKILGLASLGLSMPDALVQAGEAATERRIWRETPKAPKPVKPAKPVLVNPATKAELEAVVRAEFGTQVRICFHDQTAAEMRFSFVLEPIRDPNALESYKVTVSARHGVTVKHDWKDGKPFVKDRERFDAVRALKDALPAIRKEYETGER